MIYFSDMIAMAVLAWMALFFIKKLLNSSVKKQNREVLTVFAWCMMTCVLYLGLENRFMGIIIPVEAVLFLFGSFCSQKDRLTVFLASVITLLLLIVSGAVSILLVLVSTGMETFRILRQFNIAYAGGLLTACLLFFYISRLMLRTLDKGKRIQSAELISLLVIPFLTICSICAELAISQDISPDELHKPVWFLIMLGIVLINVAAYSYCTILRKEYQLEMRYALLQQQYADMKESSREVEHYYREASRMSHDFKHHLNMIMSRVDEKDGNGIREYIEQVLEQDIGIEKSRIVYCDNPAVNYILNTCISRCISLGIEISCVVTAALKDVDEIGTGIVLGNLLDNAIEASAEVEKPYIQICIQGDDELCEIMIKNAVDHSVLGYNPHLETTKKDKSRHGIGIKSVSDIVDSWNGAMEFYEQNRCFCCRIIAAWDNIRKKEREK